VHTNSSESGMGAHTAWASHGFDQHGFTPERGETYKMRENERPLYTLNIRYYCWNCHVFEEMVLN